MTLSQEDVPNEVLIATNNKGKFLEISSLLNSIKIKAISPFEYNILEPEEDGNSFAENALIKAKFYAKETNIFTISDDSGLCIVDLNNQPGIYSARFATDKYGNKNFELAFKNIFQELKRRGINPKNKPKAFFVCNLCFFNPKNNQHINFEGIVNGYLSYPALGDKGFGYDPIFIKDGMNKTFGEIDQDLKDSISHRAEAFKLMINWLKKISQNSNL